MELYKGNGGEARNQTGERQAGGKNGGGAVLTKDAREFLKKYEQMEEGIKEMVDERFKNIFRVGNPKF